MFNSDLLRDKIKAAGFRIDYVADQLQISYQAFWNKMNKKNGIHSGRNWRTERSSSSFGCGCNVNFFY